MHKLIALSAEKGASIWLSSLPLKDCGFRLGKQEFADALCMRYDLRLKDVPKNCTCGSPYTINHCLTCKNGGFVNIRHNTVRDTIAELLSDVCKDDRCPVTGEVLPPGTNVADGARADTSALGFWLPFSRAFFDALVFNPQAPSNWNKEIPRMYTHYEQSKKRSYNAPFNSLPHIPPRQRGFWEKNLPGVRKICPTPGGGGIFMLKNYLKCNF